MDNGLTNFRVIQASRDKPFLCPEFPSSRRIATITATPNTKRHNVHHELCFIAVLLHLIFEDCNYKPSRFLKKNLFHENFMRRINEQPIYLYTRAITNAHPMPHSSQQASRSSAEISTEILPPLWIHNLSDIASAAPKACVKIKPGTLRTWKLVMVFFNVPPYLLYLVVVYF